jgi:hypothetical protein
VQRQLWHGLLRRQLRHLHTTNRDLRRRLPSESVELRQCVRLHLLSDRRWRVGCRDTELDALGGHLQPQPLR